MKQRSVQEENRPMRTILEAQHATQTSSRDVNMPDLHPTASPWWIKVLPYSQPPSQSPATANDFPPGAFNAGFSVVCTRTGTQDHPYNTQSLHHHLRHAHHRPAQPPGDLLVTNISIRFSVTSQCESSSTNPARKGTNTINSQCSRSLG